MPLAIRLIALVFVTTFMFQAGLATPRGSLNQAMKHPGELVRGLLLILVVGPLVALLVASAFGLAPPIRASLVLLSVVGLAPVAGRSVRSASGDVPVAIVLTIVLGLITVFTAAPMAKLLLAYPGGIPVRPAALIGKLVLLQVLPLALGLALRSASERVRKAERVARAVNTVAFVALLIAIIVPHLRDVSALGWRGVLASIVLATILAMLGFAFGGPTPQGRRTLVTIANTPNIALALGIAAEVNAAPIFSVTLIGAFLVRVLESTLLRLVYVRRSRRGRRAPGASAEAPATA